MSLGQVRQLLVDDGVGKIALAAWGKAARPGEVGETEGVVCVKVWLRNMMLKALSLQAEAAAEDSFHEALESIVTKLRESIDVLSNDEAIASVCADVNANNVNKI